MKKNHKYVAWYYHALKKTFLVMRIVIVISLVCIMQSFALESYAQNSKISLSAKEMKLEEIMMRIEDQTKYRFAYNKTEIDVDISYSIDINNLEIKELLDKLFSKGDIVYNIIDRQIVLSSSKKSTFAQQQKSVSGKVTDSSGNSLPGVSVVVKGTTNGTITDVDGSYSLLNIPDNATLQFSFVGMKMQEVAVLGKTTLNITMEEETVGIEEVVAVGYGTQRKVNLTGAVSMVKMDDVLGNRPVTTIGSALQGTIPGLQITATNGSPGASQTFNIRSSMGSINGGSPLILVDNVEMDINMLDPADIETVSVLKDAASSAIYGARAAFGVILITTKKGSSIAGENKFTLTYSNNFSYSNPTNLPQKATPLQTVQGYKDFGTTTYWSGHNVDTYLSYLNEYQSNPSKYPDGFAIGTGGLRYSLAETNLFSDMIETGFQQKHNFSAGGGNKNISYRLALGLVDQDGILVSSNDTYKRYNVSSYIRSDAYSWITPELDIKISKSTTLIPNDNASNGSWDLAARLASYLPLGTIKSSEGIELPVSTPGNLIKMRTPQNTGKYDARVFGKVTIKPFKDVNIIGEYTYNRKSNQITDIEKKITTIDGMVFLQQQTPVSSYQYRIDYTDYNAINLYGNYTKKLEEHEITLLGGFNQESSFYQYAGVKRLDMINDQLPSISQGTGAITANDNFSEFRSRGLFYRLNYSYAGKYLLESNGRYDGSSKFPTDSRFGFFPSISAGWRISEESFLESAKNILSNLKLRGSWGNIGNQSINPYAYTPGMNSGYAAWLVDGRQVTTLYAPLLVSNSFTWEKVSTIDIGIDMGLFDNRFSTVFDIYQRNTSGMLAKGSQLPALLGADAPLQNVADLGINGWELTTGWKDKIGKVSYNLNFNLFDSKTKITKYDNSVGNLNDYRVGQELNEIWGYSSERLYTEADFENGKLKAGIPFVEGFASPNPGDVLYKDMDGNGIIDKGKNTLTDSGDRRIIGNSTRHLQYGIQGGASYEGFSLSFFLQGVGKRDLWIMNELFYPHYSTWSTLYDSQLDYWTPERPNSYFPRIYNAAAVNTAANTLSQSRFLQNGAYLNIKNITLSYAFPSHLIKRYLAKEFSVYVSGENLFTFDHLPKGIGSESNSSELGAAGLTYPYTRQISFGINLTF